MKLIVDANPAFCTNYLAIVNTIDRHVREDPNVVVRGSGDYLFTGRQLQPAFLVVDTYVFPKLQRSWRDQLSDDVSGDLAGR